MPAARIVVVGAGLGGLTAAALLAQHGLRVTVVERAPRSGGKLRQLAVGGALVDSGPTVLTLREIFDELFEALGTSLDTHLALRPLSVLARHAWARGERLDLHADAERTADAIAAFAGRAEADGYRSFCRRAQRSFAALEAAYLRAAQPSLPGMLRRIGLGGLGALWQARPMANLWQVLGEHFKDVRLRQLFGRYATYSGASPFLAPATLMVIAHVEQRGVWLVEGGMQRIAEALESLCRARGVAFAHGREVHEVLVAGGRAAGVALASGERLTADAVVLNADAAALAAGSFGRAAAGAAGGHARRSLSALTWSMHVETAGFPLLHHSVFFSSDYRAEFDDIFGRSRLPGEPTVYVCAADRGDSDATRLDGPERLFCLVNAPATGDRQAPSEAEIEACETTTFRLLQRAGLTLQRTSGATIRTGPVEFERLFPATGGALYGPVQHGWQAAFRRPGVRSRLPGLYLTGGSTHPGPGLPMVALSGRQAAAAVLADQANPASTGRSRPVAMPGGTSMR